MRISTEHARLLQRQQAPRLRSRSARRIALLGAGQFTRALLGALDHPAQFAGATITAILDENAQRGGDTIGSAPVVRSLDGCEIDALVIATPMHEPALLRRAAAGAFGAVPVLGMHTIESEAELDVDTLLLPETAWFGLDLPGLLRQAGRSCVIAGAAGMPGFHDVITDEFWAEHAKTPAQRLSWDELDLFEFVRGSAACLLGRARIDPAADRDTLTSLMEETIRIYESAHRSFSSSRAPGTVVVANGLLHHQRAVAEAALRAGKRAVAIEASCFPGLCHLELGAAQTGARSAMGRAVRDRLEGRTLTSVRRERIASYLRDRNPHAERRIDSASQPPPESAQSLRRILDIPDDHRVLLLLGQVCTDTTLVYDAPVFNDVPELARAAAAVVAETPGWTLVIKPHPKEQTGLDPVAGRPYAHTAHDRLKQDPITSLPHACLVGPTDHNVYALMRLASAGLAINSQSALEMTAMFGKPVCLVGRAAFSGWGFTRDVAQREAFEPTLRALLDAPTLTPEQHDLALKHADHAVFEFLIPTDVRTPAEALRRDNEALHALLAREGVPSVIESKPEPSFTAA